MTYMFYLFASNRAETLQELALTNPAKAADCDEIFFRIAEDSTAQKVPLTLAQPIPQPAQDFIQVEHEDFAQLNQSVHVTLEPQDDFEEDMDF